MKLTEIKRERKTLFITGASSGIGQALAREYAELGFNLALLARRHDRLSQFVQELGGESRAVAIECDVREVSQLKRAVKICLEKFGSIDVVVANAGFGISGAFEKLSVEDYRKQFDTNIFGVLHTLQETLPSLKESRGKIAIIGSVNSYLSEPKKTPYCMSKFAIKALADGLYWELKSTGVSVTLLCPGLIESEIRKKSKDELFDPLAQEQVPEYLIMPAKKAARQILKAIEARKKEVVITFHGKLLVFLQRHCPYLLRPLFKGGRSISRNRPQN